MEENISDREMYQRGYEVCNRKNSRQIKELKIELNIIKKIIDRQIRVICIVEELSRIDINETNDYEETSQRMFSALSDLMVVASKSSIKE